MPEQVLTTRRWYGEVDKLSPSRIILFPSLAEGRLFTTAMGGALLDFKSPVTKRKLARSRYTILGPQDSSQKYILIYTNQISGDKLTFLLDFLQQSSLAAKEAQRANGLRGSTTKAVVSAYTAKFGFNFVSADEELSKAAVRNSAIGWTTFVESKALNVIVGPANIHIASSFLEEKVDMTFGMFDWEMIESFAEVMNLLGGYEDALVRIHSTHGIGQLENLLLLRFEENHSKVARRLRRHPDLIAALNYIVGHTNGVRVDTRYSEYLRDKETILVEATRMLKPDYVWLGEVLELALASRVYSRQIELGLQGNTDRFGPTGRFLAKCEEVSNKQGTYPEVRIYAGKAAAWVLESQILKNHDFGAYLKYVNLCRTEAILLESAIPVIKKKNPGSPVKFLDAALGLLSAHAIARMLGETEEAGRLYLEASEYVERHDIRQVKVQILWTDFLKTHDYDYLREIYRLHIASNPKEFAGFGETNFFIGQVAAVLLEESDYNKTLDEAEEFLGRDVSPDSMIGIVMDQFGLEASLYISRLLRSIFSCLDSVDDNKIGSLRTIIKVMDSEISPISYVRTLVLKSEILYGVLDGNSVTVEKGAVKMSRFANPKSPVWLFIEAAQRWVRTPAERRGLKFFQVLENELDMQDPWSRILTDFIRSNTKRELRPEDIFDYDGIVFVEGKTDARVYPILLGKVSKDRRMLFIDVEGWTNMDYFANAKIVKEFGRPVHVVFDGDTGSKRNRDIKRRLVTELKLPKARIITLRKNALEDYLLVPRAIKQAFPDMRLSVEELARLVREAKKKKNKKGVLDSLLREYAGSRFSDTTAARIADKLLPSEVGQELKGMLG